MTSTTEDVLKSIDGALTACGYIDFGETGSSMRWRPEPPEPADVHDGLVRMEIRAVFTVAAHFRLPGGLNLCLRAEIRDVKDKTAAARWMRAAYSRPGWRPRPDSHCEDCNPRGNPGPLAVDGRAYQRRLKSRRRRR